jgi:hypothetical protein
VQKQIADLLPGAIDIDEFNVIMRLMTKRAHMHSNQRGSIFGRSKLIKTEGGR